MVDPATILAGGFGVNLVELIFMIIYYLLVGLLKLIMRCVTRKEKRAAIQTEKERRIKLEVVNLLKKKSSLLGTSRKQKRKNGGDEVDASRSFKPVGRDKDGEEFKNEFGRVANFIIEKDVEKHLMDRCHLLVRERELIKKEKGGGKNKRTPPPSPIMAATDSTDL